MEYPHAPSLGRSANEVIDNFKAFEERWKGLCVVEAVTLENLRFRWMLNSSRSPSTTVLGISEYDGLTLRPATEQEYLALEQGLCAGQIQITSLNRISRQITVLHQATGASLKLECSEVHHV